MLRKLGGFLFETVQVVIFAISIFLFIYLLVLQPHKIKGESMEPNFHNNEYLLTDKVTYRLSEPQRGDVIVFKAPPDYKEEFIKRIIGLPGDEVSLKEGKVYINGNELKETYLPSNQITSPGRYMLEDKVVTIPEGKYLVFGDNRGHSLDSRAFGPIEFNKITGRAWIIYWPVAEAGAVESPNYFF